MDKLADRLPSFCSELKEAVVAQDRTDLLEQLPNLTLKEWTGDADAMWLYVGGTRELNIVEQNVIGVRYVESIPLDACPGMVVIDPDNFGRISGIELINRPDVYRSLA